MTAEGVSAMLLSSLLPAICLLAALLFAPKRLRAEINNLVYNPGFEVLSNNFADGWSSFTAADAERFELSNDEVYTGRYSMHLLSTESKPWSPLFSKMLTLSSGSEYTLCAFCKSNLVDAEMVFALREVDAASQSVTFQQVAIPQHSDWTYVSATFKVGATTTSGQIFLMLRNGTGEAWIDAVLLTPGKPDALRQYASQKAKPANPPRKIAALIAGQNLLPDLLNKSGKIANEWVFTADNPRQSVLVDPSIRLYGTNSVCQKHKDGGVPGSWLTLRKPLPVRSGSRLLLSAWIRTSGHSNWTGVPVDRAKRDEGACVKLQFLDDKMQVVSDYWSRTLQTSGEWQRVQAEGKAPVTASYVSVALFHGDLLGSSWFTAIRLEQAANKDDVSTSWRLPKSTIKPDMLPLNFSGKAELVATPDSDELAVLIRSKRAVQFPPIDNSFPGSYRISGQIKGSASVVFTLGCYDINDNLTSQTVVNVDAVVNGQRWQYDFQPDVNCAYFTLTASCSEGSARLWEFHAYKLSSMSLNDYMAAPPPTKLADHYTSSSMMPAAKCVMRGCMPVMTVNGKAVNFNQYWFEHVPHDRVIKSCRKGQLVMAVIADRIDWSTTPATVDTQALDTQIDAVLNRYPEAYITITPDTTASEHSSKPWAAYHPSERYINELGEQMVPGYSGEPRSFPSMASEAWRSDVDDMLKLLVNHVKRSKYASRVIGFQLSPYEWFQWEWMRSRMDVSAPMKTAFRRWLTMRYRDDASLQKAWHNASVRLNSAEIPSTEKRSATSDGVFRDSKTSQDAIDYARFYNELIADMLTRQADTIKTAAGTPTLVGSFYGYITTMIDGPSRQSSGHLALNRLVSSKKIDYLLAPSDGYIFDREIGGAGGYMSTIDTCRLHGVMWVNQPDFRTHWAADNLARTETIVDDVELHMREFAMNLTAHTAQQFLDFSQGYSLGDRRFGQMLAQQAQIYQFAQSLDPEPDINQMAVVISETAADYVGTQQVMMDGGLVYHQRPLYYRTGMPFTNCLTSDIEKLSAKNCRLWVFPNIFHLTPHERKLIESVCMRRGNVVAFVYAPGYVESSPSAANIGQLTGIAVQPVTMSDARVTISADKTAYTRESSGIRYGHSPKFPWSPLFAVADSKATVLGRYSDGHVGLAAHSINGCHIVYSGVGMLPPSLLRDLGRLSRSHIYLSTNDAVYASHHFVAIHARSTGVKHVSLPRRSDVYELISHRTIATNSNSFTVSMKAFTTKLFYLGDAARADAFFKGRQE